MPPYSSGAKYVVTVHVPDKTHPVGYWNAVCWDYDNPENERRPATFGTLAGAEAHIRHLKENYDHGQATYEILELT